MKRILLAMVGLGLMALSTGCCHHLFGAPNPCSPCGPYGAVGVAQPMSYAAAPACSTCQPF